MSNIEAVQEKIGKYIDSAELLILIGNVKERIESQAIIQALKALDIFCFELKNECIEEKNSETMTDSEKKNAIRWISSLSVSELAGLCSPPAFC